MAYMRHRVEGFLVIYDLMPAGIAPIGTNERYRVTPSLQSTLCVAASLGAFLGLAAPSRP